MKNLLIVTLQYQTLEETYKNLQKEAASLDQLIMCASETLQVTNVLETDQYSTVFLIQSRCSRFNSLYLQSLLKLRKRQDHVLVRTFDGKSSISLKTRNLFFPSYVLLVYKSTEKFQAKL